MPSISVVKNAKTLITSLLVLATLTACKSTPKADYDTQYDFSQLKSFSHMEQVAPQDPLSATRIEQAISTSLTTQGFTEVANAADFLVNYRFVTQEKPKNSGLSIGLGTGTGGRHGGIGVGTTVGVPIGDDTVTEQVIQIDIIDPQTNKLVWRGSDKFDVEQDVDEKAQDTKNTVQNILAQFPPQKVKD